jgi:predicted RNA binding protein YcfA (HicA-like mRNA interferase family)
MSRRTQSLRPAQVIELLERAGWSQKRQTGSHVIMVKVGQRSIPVPVYSKELKRGLMMVIFKQTVLTSEEVEKLLDE